MKNLSDYIETTNINQIDESLLCHLAIEYKVNDIGTGRNIVNEKYGIYDGCEELADYIVNDIFSNITLDNEYHYHKGELSDIKNIFFNELVVDLDTSSDTGGECDDNINIGKDLLVDEVFINLYLANPTKTEVKGFLMHELTHLYNNYVMQLKGDMNYMKVANSELYRNITTSGGGSKFIVPKVLESSANSLFSAIFSLCFPFKLSVPPSIALYKFSIVPYS